MPFWGVIQHPLAPKRVITFLNVNIARSVGHYFHTNVHISSNFPLTQLGAISVIKVLHKVAMDLVL